MSKCDFMLYSYSLYRIGIYKMVVIGFDDWLDLGDWEIEKN